MGRFAQDELGLALANDCFLVGRDEADVLVELAYAGDPAGEHAQLAGDDRHLGHADHANDTQRNEVTGGLLAHVFAQHGAL